MRSVCTTIDQNDRNFIVTAHLLLEKGILKLSLILWDHQIYHKWLPPLTSSTQKFLSGCFLSCFQACINLVSCSEQHRMQLSSFWLVRELPACWQKPIKCKWCYSYLVFNMLVVTLNLQLCWFLVHSTVRFRNIYSLCHCLFKDCHSLQCTNAKSSCFYPAPRHWNSLLKLSERDFPINSHLSPGRA